MNGFGRLGISVLFALTIAGCDAVFDGECVCTLEARMYFLRVVDQEGNPIPGAEIVATIPRTADTLDLSLIPSYPPELGVYGVFGDFYLNQIDPDGDVVRVSGVANGSDFTVDYVFSVPGKCRCHVNKVSGPDGPVIVP